jgi:site-specific DNA-cytosine methylase
MRVLVACEFSGVVREAFRKRGHDALSCDLLPTEIEGPHYQGDVRDVLGNGWDLMIAHPPCTHLAVSGAKHFHRKAVEQEEALDFVRLLLDAPIAKIALENPVSIISSRIRKPDQIVHPYWFGDPYKKKTCLWLKGLPKLVATNLVEPEPDVVMKSGARMAKWYYDAKCGNKDWAKIRSTTFPGFAEAMAGQWGIGG